MHKNITAHFVRVFHCTMQYMCRYQVTISLDHIYEFGGAVHLWVRPGEIGVISDALSFQCCICQSQATIPLFSACASPILVSLWFCTVIISCGGLQVCPYTNHVDRMQWWTVVRPESRLNSRGHCLKRGLCPQKFYEAVYKPDNGPHVSSLILRSSSTPRLDS